VRRVPASFHVLKRAWQHVVRRVLCVCSRHGCSDPVQCHPRHCLRDPRNL
jgi:hypothetical protein